MNEKPLLSFDPKHIGSSIFLSPRSSDVNEHEDILNSYNRLLLSSQPPTLKKIKEHIRAAEDEIKFADSKLKHVHDTDLEYRDVVYLSAKLSLHSAQDKLLQAQAWLLPRITQKHHMSSDFKLETLETLPTDTEFVIFDRTQSDLLFIHRTLIDLTFDLIEVYIRRGLVYHTDYFFDELKKRGDLNSYEKRLQNLKNIAEKLKSEGF